MFLAADVMNIRFSEGADAVRALAEADGRIFQGRLLHVLAAHEEEHKAVSSKPKVAGGSYKQELEDRRKSAWNNTLGWNSLFLSTGIIASA